MKNYCTCDDPEELIYDLCPYDEEGIDAEPSGELCSCCEWCRYNCAQDI